MAKNKTMPVFETPEEDSGRVLYNDKADASKDSLAETRKNRSQWLKNNNKSYYVRFSRKDDAEIIKYFDSMSNKKGYLVQLIENDLDRDDPIEF